MGLLTADVALVTVRDPAVGGWDMRQMLKVGNMMQMSEMR
jgi:hypothetical protein